MGPTLNLLKSDLNSGDLTRNTYGMLVLTLTIAIYSSPTYMETFTNFKNQVHIRVSIQRCFCSNKDV